MSRDPWDERDAVDYAITGLMLAALLAMLVFTVYMVAIEVDAIADAWSEVK